MSWLNPESAIGLLAIPILCVLYLIRERAKRQETTVFLWRRALSERSAWSRMRPWVSAAWRSAVVVLLVLAMAAPILGPRETRTRDFVFVLDATLGMHATDVQPSRFEAARSAAQEALSKLGPLDRAALIVVGGEPHVDVPLTIDRQPLEVALHSTAADWLEGDCEAAVQAADLMLRDSPGGVILLFSAQAPNEKSRLSDAQLLVATFADSPTNTGVVSLSARRIAHNPASDANDASPARQLVARFTQTGSPRTVKLQWLVNREVAAEQELQFEEGRATALFNANVGDDVEVRLAADDDFALDDSASLTLSSESIQFADVDGTDVVVSGQSNPLPEFETGQQPARPAHRWFFGLALLVWLGEWLAFLVGVTE